MSSSQSENKDDFLAQPEPQAPTDEALANFSNWFCRNYPGPDTIIHKPEWHAPKVFRAAAYAIARWGTPTWRMERRSGPRPEELRDEDLEATARAAEIQPEPEFTAEEVEMIQAPWSLLSPPQPEPEGPTDEAWEWYSYCPEDGIELHLNKELAQKAAQEVMGSYAKAAYSDGWHEDMESVSWGMLLPVEQAQVVERTEAEPDSEFDEWIRYELVPSRYARPAIEPVAVSEMFEFSVFDSEYEEQAGGTAPTYSQALSEGQHYLAMYSQDGPHSLEIRRVEVLSHHALPAPGAEVGS